jgi:hypothetical protein
MHLAILPVDRAVPWIALDLGLEFGGFGRGDLAVDVEIH